MAYAFFIDHGVCHTPLPKPGHPTPTFHRTRGWAQPASTARSLSNQGRGKMGVLYLGSMLLPRPQNWN